MNRTCKQCGDTFDIEFFRRHGRYYSFSVLELSPHNFLDTCKYCREKWRSRIEKKKEAKKERGRKLRNMMHYLKADDRQDWQYKNQKAINVVNKDFNTHGYLHLYYDKDKRIVTETQTLQLNINQLINKK
jgi:hypothetical protein